MRSRLSLVGVIAAAVVIAVLTASCGFLPGGGGSYAMTVHFPRAVSLYPGGQVRVLGLPAGRVTSVETETDRVRVKLSIDDDIPVPANARAAIVAQSLIGERYVHLMPAWTEGQPKAKDGHVINVDDTVVPVEPDDALAALKEFLDSLDPQGLGRLVHNVAGDLEGNGAALNQALGSISDLATTFAENDDRVVSIMENFDRFTQTLRTREAQLGQVLDAFAGATQVLADEREDLEVLLANLASLSQNSYDLVAKHGAELRTDISTLNDAVATIDANLDSVAQLLDSGPILVSGLEAAYNPELRAINLRNNFAPLFQQLFNPILRSLLDDPDFEFPCLPLLGTTCSTAATALDGTDDTVAATESNLTPRQADLAQRQALTPLGDVLGFLEGSEGDR